MPSVDVKRKRERESKDEPDEWDTAAGLEAIGYTTSHLLSNLEIDVRPAFPDDHRCVRFLILFLTYNSRIAKQVLGSIVPTLKAAPN